MHNGAKKRRFLMKCLEKLENFYYVSSEKQEGKDYS